MNFEVLQQYCDVIRLRSFSKAAVLHNITQSTVSQAIQLLEKEFNATLIDRSKRPWRPTREGETAYQELKDLVAKFRSLKRSIQADGDPEVRPVTVAAIYSVGLHQMNSVIQEYMKVNPEHKVLLKCLHPDEVYSNVRNNEADLGIVSFPDNGRDFRVIPWRDEIMVAVCAAEHPLAGRKQIRPQDMNTFDFVHFTDGLKIRGEIDNFLKYHNVKVNISLEFDNIESIKQAVRAGSGIALLPAPSVEQEVRTGTLVSLHLKKCNFNRPLGIIQKASKATAEDTGIFIDFLKART